MRDVTLHSPVKLYLLMASYLTEGASSLRLFSDSLSLCGRLRLGVPRAAHQMFSNSPPLMQRAASLCCYTHRPPMISSTPSEDFKGAPLIKHISPSMLNSHAADDTPPAARTDIKHASLILLHILPARLFPPLFPDFI